MNQIDELRWQLHCALHDIQAYRGALGYSIPGDHNGKLMDGTTPQCGMCNSEYRRNLEAKVAILRGACQKALSWCTGKGEYSDCRDTIEALAEEVAVTLANALETTR